MPRKVSKERFQSIVDKAINEGQILTGTVKTCNRENKDRYLSIEISDRIFPENTRVWVSRKEADNSLQAANLAYLVGAVVPVIITSKEEDGTLFGSRRLAQDKIQDMLLDDFAQGKKFQGTILHYAVTGANVSVHGVVGFLKNEDFSIDKSEVQEYKHPGDKIEVVCKSIDPKSGRIFWEAVEKVHRAEPIELGFDVGSTVSGRVVDVRPFGDKRNGNSLTPPYAFVKERPGLDILCIIPYEMDVVKGQNVSLTVTSIEPDNSNPYAPPKIKGSIKRII